MLSNIGEGGFIENLLRKFSDTGQARAGGDAGGTRDPGPALGWKGIAPQARRDVNIPRPWAGGF